MAATSTGDVRADVRWAWQEEQPQEPPLGPVPDVIVSAPDVVGVDLMRPPMLSRPPRAPGQRPPVMSIDTSSQPSSPRFLLGAHHHRAPVLASGQGAGILAGGAAPGNDLPPAACGVNDPLSPTPLSPWCQASPKSATTGGGGLRSRRRPNLSWKLPTPTNNDSPVRNGRGAWSLNLLTPSSCASPCKWNIQDWNLETPDPERGDMTMLEGDVGAVLFDFDGTLTSVPGDSAKRSRKQRDLQERAPLLAPHLRALRDSEITLGIISKSTEQTVRSALREAGLADFFDGPILGKAVGFEGKAGFIEDLVFRGELTHLGADGLRRVLLVDDDVRELDRARARGIQTYAAPQEGGLQEGDFNEIFARLGLQAYTSGSLSPGNRSRSRTPTSPTKAGATQQI